MIFIYGNGYLHTNIIIIIHLKYTGNSSGVMTSRAFHPAVDMPANMHVNTTMLLVVEGKPQMRNVLIPDSTIETAAEKTKVNKGGSRRDEGGSRRDERKGEMGKGRIINTITYLAVALTLSV